MKVDVTSLLKKPGKEKDYSGVWQPDDLPFHGEDVKLNGGLSVTFKLINADDHIQVDGNYEGSIELQCARCLSPYNDAVQSHVEAKFFSLDSGGLPEGTYKEDREIVAEEGGIYLDTFEDNTVDLSDVVRQDILLESPMRPLCESDCEGLCPVCGQNLNEEDCGHDTEDVDPRLSALQEIDIEEEQ